ncbi:MAG: nucleotide exchange factor GrpE [Mariprofundaceae bacterium]|nr:nucleotide exchange factor GrpE [Mariprofundaceae bacterium]
MSSKNKKQDIEEQEMNDSEVGQDEVAEETSLDDDVLTVDEEGEPIDPMQALKNEVAELNDKLLRQHAEMDNLRKRTAREVVDARKFAVEKFAVALLDVVDNLERALDVEEGNEEGLRDGVQRTLDAWHGMMGKFELERIDAVGEQFDPHKHEALSQIPSEESEGTVINQHCAGYTLSGRLIRPAQVLISSGK